MNLIRGRGDVPFYTFRGLKITFHFSLAVYRNRVNKTFREGDVHLETLNVKFPSNSTIEAVTDRSFSLFNSETFGLHASSLKRTSPLRLIAS